jgi:hypothetical protein
MDYILESIYFPNSTEKEPINLIAVTTFLRLIRVATLQKKKIPGYFFGSKDFIVWIYYFLPINGFTINKFIRKMHKKITNV